ncbi:hypothetical protein GCM10023093_19870 [Nemorincola caseinilytica]|uniref:Secretion system C-terminal sorting domain-containing protein n=1 Tax=Nemorincola caseinilytica TaxID=2054315 RepID=A0ABP8NI08_9BACT
MNKPGLLLFIVLLLSLAARSQTITGPGTICGGSIITYAGSPGGGTWSITPSPVATVNPATGGVEGYSAGTTTLTYTIAGGAFTTMPITVLAGATITTTGTRKTCVGGTITHVGAGPGGTWSISPTSVASVSGGSVLGISPGIATVTYSVSSGCSATLTDTIVAVPTAIGGTLSLCDGSTTTLTNTVTGGTWSSATPAVATVGAFTGIVTGLMPGTATITYTVASGCTATAVVTVTASPTMTVGSGGMICVGATATITGSPTGGAWTVSPLSVATPSMGGVTGVSAGTATVTYSVSGCNTTSVVTVMPTATVSVGSGNLCLGSPYTASATPAGGTWSSSSSAVSIAAATGVMTPVSVGTASITYTLASGCFAVATVTVNSLPTVSASVTPAACGNGYTLSGSGASTYVWTPGFGLSCSSCTSPTTSPTGPMTYYVTGYSAAGCTDSASISISGNRIYGHISFSGMAPASPAMKVWLIQYNPTDSSITATDSMNSCLDGGFPYYQFDGKPAGNYLVKAKLNSAVPGTSDYIPTYGASTPNWYAAATVAHGTGTNVQDITMIYGTVPSGPGFISGYVYSGAGRGTASEIPVEGMIVFLKNAAGDVLTYTYTNALGAYSFGSLAYGSYVIYPAEQSYYTTPSAIITLSAATPSATAVSFKQYTTSGIILPYMSPSGINTTLPDNTTGVYPNPARDHLNIKTGVASAMEVSLVLADVTGRVVFSSLATTNENGELRADLTKVPAGMYVIRVTSALYNYTGKLLVAE